MKNRYHHKLQLPVKFIPKLLTFDVGMNFAHVRYDPSEVNQDLIDFLKGLGVSIYGVEVFGRSPTTLNGIHLDGSDFTNDTKINFVFGHGDMDWYELKPDGKLIHGMTRNNTPYLNAKDDDCNKVWTAKINNTGGLVNVGGLHGLSNIITDRWCYCLMLGDIANNNKQLQWDKAIELFKGYYV